MGLLTPGSALEWETAERYVDHVRDHGISQFLYTWDRHKDRTGDQFLWGDEIEYMVVVFDDNKNAKLSLRQPEILASLGADVAFDPPSHISPPNFFPEYASYMLESTPGRPYTGSITDLLSVESDMHYRRMLIRKHLKPNEVPLTFTSFPRLGVLDQFTEPYFDPKGAISSHSLFVPEEISSPHVRFLTLVTNIRRRRGSKVAANLPIFMDSKTPKPFNDPTIPLYRDIYPEDSEARLGAALTNHIYVDAPAFGMGCCCLQVTLQAGNISDARRLYDGLIPITPILMALTAASPIWRGYLADVDCRWNVISGVVDDRTEEERSIKPLKEKKHRIPKSRYDTVDLYISEDWCNRPEYNDTYVPYDDRIYKRMRDHGVDDLLSRHMSHLFLRDPLVIFWEKIDQDDTVSTDHFENIQSTNWQTLRFKPPPPNSTTGWRVEFRSMEVQISDFENAAFSVFVVLLSRAILYFNLNFYIPMSKVDENMQTAQQRDAAATKTFFFRKNIYTTNPSAASSVASSRSRSPVSTVPKRMEGSLTNHFASPPPQEIDFTHNPTEDEYEEMKLAEIMNGKDANFPGLIPLVEAYLETLDLEDEHQEQIDTYLRLIKYRSNGRLVTPATWIRKFVLQHPDYKHDSVVPQSINYDLLKAVDEIERGVREVPDLMIR